MHTWMTGWLDEIMNVCVSLLATLTPENTCHTQAHTGHQIRLIAKQHSDSPHCWTRNFPSLNSCTQDGTQSNLLVLQLPTNGLEWRIPAVKWKPHNNNLIDNNFWHVQRCVDRELHLKKRKSLSLQTAKNLETWQHGVSYFVPNLTGTWTLHLKKKAAGLRGFVSTLWHWSFVWKSPSFRSFDLRIEHSLQQRKSDVPLTAPSVGPRGGSWRCNHVNITITKKTARHNLYQDHLSPCMWRRINIHIYI